MAICHPKHSYSTKEQFLKEFWIFSLREFEAFYFFFKDFWFSWHFSFVWIYSNILSTWQNNQKINYAFSSFFFPIFSLWLIHFWVKKPQHGKYTSLMRRDDENPFERVHFWSKLVHIASPKAKGYGSNQIALGAMGKLTFWLMCPKALIKGGRVISGDHGQRAWKSSKQSRMITNNEFEVGLGIFEHIWS